MPLLVEGEQFGGHVPAAALERVAHSPHVDPVADVGCVAQQDRACAPEQVQVVLVDALDQ